MLRVQEDKNTAPFERPLQLCIVGTLHQVDIEAKNDFRVDFVEASFQSGLVAVLSNVESVTEEDAWFSGRHLVAQLPVWLHFPEELRHSGSIYSISQVGKHLAQECFARG